MKKLPVPTTCITCQDFSYCGEKDMLTLAACEYYVKAYARYKEIKTVGDVLRASDLLSKF